MVGERVRAGIDGEAGAAASARSSGKSRQAGEVLGEPWSGWLGGTRMGVTMRALKAHVRGGRLVLDEPTELPEGTEVELVAVDDEVLASGGDHLDDEERERLHASIERGREDVRAGRTVDAEQVIAKLRARTAGR